jgi:predicted dienelactone hydrolase
VAVGGHSFGAYTALLVGGATIELPDSSHDVSYADPRPQALLGLSAQGGGWMGLSDRSWQGLTRPMLLMTGTFDRGLGGQNPAWRLEPYWLAPEGEKYSIFLDGGNHLTFTGMPARSGRQPELLFDAVKVATLAFFDAYLRDSARARVWLASDSLLRGSDSAAHLERR